MPWKDLVSPGPSGSTGDLNGMTTRTVIPVAAYGGSVPATGTKIRITIGTFAGGTADKVYIGHAAASGDAYDFDGTQVQLSAFASTTWSISTFRIGNVADYAFDKTKPLVVAIHWSGTSDANQPSGTGYISAIKAGDDASTTNVSGYGLAAANTAIGVVRVEVFTPEADWYPLHNITLNSSIGTASTETLSQVIPVAVYDASVPTTGSKVRITIQGGNTSGITWDKMYVGHAASSGDAWDFDGTQVQVTFGGNVVGSVGFPQTLVTSDPVNYAFNKTKPLVIRLHASIASGTGSLLGGPATGFTAASTSGDVTATSDVGGTIQTNAIYATSMVEVYTGAGGGSAAVFVQEITMAAPDVICVELRDPAIVRSTIVDSGSLWTGSGSYAVTNVANNGSGLCRVTIGSAGFNPSVNQPGGTGHGATWGFHSIGGVSGANGCFDTIFVSSTQVDLANSVFSGSYTSGGRAVDYQYWVDYLSDKYALLGPEMRYVRKQDTRPGIYLDRAAAAVAANYGITGGRTITGVYRKTDPYSSGEIYGTSIHYFQTKATASQHFIYLKLNGALTSPGSYTISFPAGTGVPSTVFNFNDNTTRAQFIHGTQVGHRPSDVNKYAYYAGWIPGYNAPNGGEGAVELTTTYGINSFTVIDSTNAVVYTGTAAAGKFVLRLANNAAENVMRDMTGNIQANFPSLSGGKIRCCSTVIAPIAITAMTNANPGLFTTGTAHGLTTGDIIQLYAVANSGGPGPYQLNWWVGEARVTSTTQFNIREIFPTGVGTIGVNVDTTSYGTYASTPMQGLVYRTFETNRAGTHVYGLDYSAMTAADIAGKTGPYRIKLAGIGVSDAFPMDDHVWYNVAKVAAKGSYHHRLGMALDGRFGYTRPNAFDDRARLTNQPFIYESKLAAPFGELDGVNVSQRGTYIGSYDGCIPPWITTTRSNWGGSLMDAGDYVQRVSGMDISAYAALDVVEYKPVPAASVSFGIPKSSACLDPTTYASTDSLPDAVHDVIYMLDTYRRTQKGDGRVYGGLGMITGTGQYPSEPSDKYRGPCYTYAADHIGTFGYAGAAAKLSKVLSGLGFPTLAATWLASAQLAWNWAESIYQTAGTGTSNYYFAPSIAGSVPTAGPERVNNGTGYTVGDVLTVVGGTRSVPMTIKVTAVSSGVITAAVIVDWGTYSVNPTDPVSVTGGTGTGATFKVYKGGAAEVYYNTTLGTAANAGWSNTTWAGALFDVQVGAYGKRMFAAGCLFRAVGGSTYEAIIQADVNISPSGYPGAGVWEYAQAPAANTATKNTILSNLVSLPDAVHIPRVEGVACYRHISVFGDNINYYGANGGDMQSACPMFPSIVAYRISGLSKYLSAIQSHLGYVCGANQTGQTHTSQLGVRNMLNFEPDTFIRGVPTSAGVTCYGVSVQAPATAIFNFSTGPYAYITEPPSPTTTDGGTPYSVEFEAERSATPARFLRSIYESNYNQDLVLGSRERSVQQTVIPLLYTSLFLAGFDGNVDTGGSDPVAAYRVTLPKVRLR